MSAYTLQHFQVTDTTTGKMLQSGRKNASQMSAILSQKTLFDNLSETVAVPGTPVAITSGGLYGKAHMCSQWIRIVRDNGSNSEDGVYIPDQIRFTKIEGTTSCKIAILYGFAPSANTPATDITWNVLFVDGNQQENGDFWNVPLPDTTLYPNTYLAIMMYVGAWWGRTVVSEDLKICSIPNTSTYITFLDPSQANYDTNQSHMIVIQGYNANIGAASRICIACEDWIMSETDKDYNDLVISISSVALDANQTNDTSVS